MRRLPVYLLVDVSGSMSGEPIEAVKNGLQTMQSALRKDPQALEQACLSIITFESQAIQVAPLVEISKFQVPNLLASGGTSLGEALSQVTKCAQKEVQKSTPEKKGDWKPLVFLMTDGEPTDKIDSGLAEFKAYGWGNVIACAAGAHANIKILQSIAGENVLRLDTADSNTIAAFFKFVSASILSTSKSVGSGAASDVTNELPPLPPEISLAKL
jgi:uncharacterized protein YegL